MATVPEAITIAGSERALHSIEQLLNAYRAKGYRVMLHVTDGTVPSASILAKMAENTDAMLVLGAPKRAPGTVLSGPVIEVSDSRSIPVGWIPETSAESLSRFAASAAKVHRRTGTNCSTALLSQWNPQYLRLAKRMEVLLEKNKVPAFCWTADLLLREHMIEGLQSGLGAAFYVGHGRPIGWVGYHGTRIHHFENCDDPIGALFSLCCRTASRRRTGLSFSEAILLKGVAAATFGSVKDTLHTNNTRWAVNLCAGIAAGVPTLGKLIVSALPTIPSAISDYRIIGDPLAPLIGSDQSIRNASAVEVFP